MDPDELSPSGPFGFWSFPLLTTLLRSAAENSQGDSNESSDADVKERAVVHRDDDGNIEEVIVVEE